MTERKPEPEFPNVKDAVQAVRDLGKSIESVPEKVVEQAGLLKAAYWSGVGSGSSVTFIVCLLLATIWKHLRSER